MNRAVVGIGSNIEPQRNVDAACALLSDEQKVLACSSLTSTAPIGDTHQPDFLNGAVLVETTLARPGFEAYLKSVETRLGRVRGPNRNGPRTIDLDLVAWNGTVVSDDYRTRPFLREAVHQVDPALA